jgi:hypothetical protein
LWIAIVFLMANSAGGSVGRTEDTNALMALKDHQAGIHRGEGKIVDEIDKRGNKTIRRWLHMSDGKVVEVRFYISVALRPVNSPKLDCD